MNKFFSCIFAVAAAIVLTIEPNSVAFTATTATMAPMVLNETIPPTITTPTTVSMNLRFTVRPEAMNLLETVTTEAIEVYEKYQPVAMDLFDTVSDKFQTFAPVAVDRFATISVRIYKTSQPLAMKAIRKVATFTMNWLDNVAIGLEKDFGKTYGYRGVRWAWRKSQRGFKNLHAASSELYKAYRYNTLVMELFDKATFSDGFPLATLDYALFAYGRVEMKAVSLVENQSNHSVSKCSEVVVLAALSPLDSTSCNVAVTANSKVMDAAQVNIVKDDTDDILEETSNTTSIDTTKNITTLSMMDADSNVTVSDVIAEHMSAIDNQTPIVVEIAPSSTFHSKNVTSVSKIEDTKDIGLSMMDPMLASPALFVDDLSTTHDNGSLGSEVPRRKFAPLAMATSLFKRLMPPRSTPEEEKEDSQPQDDETVPSIESLDNTIAESLVEYGPITKKDWIREGQEYLDSIAMTPEEIEEQVRINENQRKLEQERKESMNTIVGCITIMALVAWYFW